MRRGKQMAHTLAVEASTRVPAYSAYLKKQNVNKGTVKDGTMFDRLPLTDKDSYLRAFPLPDLCWDGKLASSQMTISATSGSTGESFYFPRSIEQDMQYAAVAEMYLRSNFSIHTRSTLYIVGWGMGVWIGGVFSYQAVRIVAERGKYPLSVITPGTSAKDILAAVQRLGSFYDQVIIGGYPPMIKDLVDEGERTGIDWKTRAVRFIFSAEGFSEEFREYIKDHVGLSDIYRDTLNHYGTVDLGTMAHETPVSILIRRLAHDHAALNQALFGQEFRQPTLAQYIPELFWFEEENGTLLCSARSGLPLVRYDLKDAGGVVTLAQVRAIGKAHGIDLDEKIREAGIEDTVWNLPFVYVFERADFTVKLSGANIYPEEIKRVLEKDEFFQSVTGRCTLQILYNKTLDQQLVVHIERRPDKKTDALFIKKLQVAIIDALKESNSEYAYLFSHLPRARVRPKVVLWSFGSAPYFVRSGKHRWVTKDTS